jgi:urea transport system permease protein
MIRQLVTSLFLMMFASVALAQDIDISKEITALSEGSFDDKAVAIETLATSGHPRVQDILQAMRGGDLYVVEETGRIVIGNRDRRVLTIVDAATGDALGEISTRDAEKIRVNNRLRRTIDDVSSRLTLMSPDPERRLQAAENLFARGEPGNIDGIRQALAQEDDGRIALAFERAIAGINLRDDAAPEEERLGAIDIVADMGTLEAQSLLAGIAGGDDAVAEAASRAMAAVEREMALWDAGQNIAYGLSLGSVLLLAAIGLAITFGIMGVINLAHGEMVMLGAYTTFVVQEFIRTSAPGLFDFSLFIAIPLAFLVSGAVGIAIERGIVRFLYGRPLETLLATWGISLILQQATRTIFGPTNREVGNPSWMSGSVELGNLVLTWNRIWIFVFAIVVFVGLMTLLKRTRFGLFTRAVTQNREMASSMGIRTGWIDPLTFGLGSGIAGLAGVALSQIDNVSPNLGQSYIIDSFLVVVFGGVGNLWGTLTGALTLGIINKFLEPYAGAVLGKILVLVFIILFIQKRPRGLFALRGRAVES